MSTIDRARGVLVGLGLGDAWGAHSEFQSVAAIDARPALVAAPRATGGVLLITDDTQMTLAVNAAVLDVGSADPARLADALCETFVTWYHAPDNNRAPGRTCLGACAAIDAGTPWPDATRINSKGCGANMRVAGLALPSWSHEDLMGAAVLQSAITHGHPTGLVAAAATVIAVQAALSGVRIVDLAQHTLTALDDLAWPERWLGDLWTRSQDPDVEHFFSRGLAEMRGALQRVLDAPAVDDGDPCVHAGDGWIAEEALATALLCAQWYADDPVGALRRGMRTRGDSDSIAAIAGAIVGAVHGEAAFPADWVGILEHRDTLRSQADGLWALGS